MTEPRVCENGKPMSLDEMQSEAALVRGLLDCIMTLSSTKDTSATYALLDMAYERAGLLSKALDSVTAPEGRADG